MTIETGSAQNTSRPAAAESKHGKTKPGDAHGHGGAGPGGFMAILASVEAPEVATVGLATESPAALALAVLQRAAALKSAAAAGDKGLGDAVGDLDPTAVDAAMEKLLQGGVTDVSATATAPLPLPVEVQVQPEVPVDASALLAQAAQWTAMPTANFEQAKSNALHGLPGNPGALAKLAVGATKLDGSNPAISSLGEGAMGLASKASKAQKDVLARLADAQAALAAPEQVSTSSNLAADARLAQAVQKATEAPLSPVAAAHTAANMVAPARREDVARERSVFRSNVVESTAPGHTYLPSAAPGSVISAPDPVASMDSYVAEKVAYWISNDVQNAEMKLEGIGEMPVEVSIRMQGNEAHIAFRSDELQAREALENASLHLKELLQREGLVLSGVSVGTAGAGDAGGQERKSRQGSRQSGVVTVQAAQADGAAFARRSTGGALDLFV